MIIRGHGLDNNQDGCFMTSIFFCINLLIIINNIFGDYMKKTIWSSYKLKSYPALDKDIKTDVLVIGGGTCGVLCAYYLSKDFNVVLVEADKLAGCKTLRTTATITAVEDVCYTELKRKKGLKYAELYYESNLEAIKEYSRLAKKYHFDFEVVDSSKYTLDDEKLINLEYKLLKSMNADCHLFDKWSLPFNIQSGFTLHNQAQMNPMLLINELSKEFTIYENTRIEAIKKNIAYTKNNKIEAKHIVICTGYPFQRLKGGFFYKLIQYKSYVISTNNPFPFKGNNVGTKPSNLYFRSYKDKLLIGCNDMKVGKKKNGFEDLINFAIKHNLDVEDCWINQDTMSLDKVPYIGKLKKNLYVATGFNMWGMTKSMTSALIIRDMILKKENKFKHIFSPYRAMYILPLMRNLGGAILGLLKPTKKRCNHLGCGLSYNQMEDVYECSCHGSKYTKGGNLIDGPAQKNNKSCK